MAGSTQFVHRDWDPDATVLPPIDGPPSISIEFWFQSQQCVPTGIGFWFSFSPNVYDVVNDNSMCITVL